MATRWAVVNGNWSNTATWDGGTLPDAGDDVFADGKTVTIDQDVTVLSVRTSQRSGGTNGGSFVHNQGYIITADVYFNANNSINSFSNNSQIIGNIYGVTFSTGNGVACTGNAKITGNIVSQGTGSSVTSVNKSTGAGKLEIIGNISCSGASNTGVAHSSIANQSEVEIIGNLTCSGGSALVAFSINNTSGNSINTVTGNISGSDTNNNAAGLIVSSSFATLTINGISTGGNSGVGVSVSGAATVTLDKAVAGSLSTASIVGINCTSATASVAVKELEYGANGQVPATGFIRFTNTINNKITITKANSTTTTLIDINDASVYLPAESDVRDGVLYDPDLASEGTLIVPDPSNVRNGVPTDNTVGTADLTAQDFFNAIATSSDPVAIRLRNVATVETTGDQISAFNV
jgi:hypothetical protein